MAIEEKKIDKNQGTQLPADKNDELSEDDFERVSGGAGKNLDPTVTTKDCC